MPDNDKTPATPAVEVIPAEPPKKRPPAPVPTDQTGVNLASEEPMEATERLEKLLKVLEGMQLTSHETRWLRQALIVVVKVMLGPVPPG